ncbi:kinase-like domain [Fusarium albosuccineum]|uniref:Kinase-like domain n=1 Tax=Fusarium albosuccineum TaxID=1237068 RepID=A0A8H4LLK3_9HYPO|nr:kinase-like domain [Fusarium albosuccineum]
MVSIAKDIHSDIVPESACHGSVEGADPPLSIYSMPGASCLEALLCEVDMGPDQEVKHQVFVKHLARLKVFCAMLSKVTQNLPLLFGQDCPQVLMHGDLSITNILVDEDEYEITGIIDWSRPTIMPFGMDLDILFLTTGSMTLDG